ncbi:glycosyltransferase family 2 protein [Mariniflexile ostreae]|uniref:Glycosyltransferase family 2 protein n=1 Tax=Mariniflexile ostreae TaxID=1520892 RepID=A0ABV5FF93_9FLAO
MNDISVIIINYNSSHFTINCIKSITSNTSNTITYELIIIDNASNIKDFTHLKLSLDELNLPNLKLVRSKFNTGFGGGNMFGVQFANGKYYAFINNDTVLKNNCLSIMYQFLENNKNAAICSPQQYNEKDEVQKSFDHFLSLKRELLGRKLLEKLNPIEYPKRQKIYAAPLKVQSVPGSFLVVKAEAFHSVGGFDTNIFLYYEETDLCFRISKKLKNSHCYLVPEGKFTHFKGQSTPQNIEIKKELKISLMYVLRKNSGYVTYEILRWLLTFKYLLKSIFKPKYFKLFILFLKGAPISASLKQQQLIAK